MKYLQHIFALLLLTYCSLLTLAQEQPKGISVRPVTVDFSVRAGQTGEKKILITNTLEMKKQFIVYTSDWEETPQGLTFIQNLATAHDHVQNGLQLTKHFLN